MINPLIEVFTKIKTETESLMTFDVIVDVDFGILIAMTKIPLSTVILINQNMPQLLVTTGVRL